MARQPAPPAADHRALPLTVGWALATQAREPRPVVGPGVLAALFPDPPAPAHPRRTALRDLALFVAATALTLAAAHGSLLQRIWAEDGSRVLTDAYRDPWAALGQPFHGYLNVFPRLGGLVAAAFPARDAAVVLAVISAVAISLVAVFVLHATAGHIRTPALRWLLVAGTLVLPVSAFEMLDNTVNVHWWLAWAAFWALMWRPRRLPGLVAACLLCLLAPLSDPLVALLLPIAALRLVLVRERRQQLITGCYVVATAIQLASSRREPVPPGFHRSTAEISRAVQARVLLPLFGGNRLTDQLWRSHQRPAIAIAGALVLAAAITALLRWRGQRAALTVCCLCLAAASAVAPFVLRPAEIRLPLAHRTLLYVSGRYSWLPILWLLTVVVLAVDVPPAVRSRARTAALAAVTAVCVTFFATVWAVDYWYARGPASHHVEADWRASLAVATQVCAVTGQKDVLVPVVPRGFTVRVPCSRLR